MSDDAFDPRPDERPRSRSRGRRPLTLAVVVVVIAIGTAIGLVAAQRGSNDPPGGPQTTTQGPVTPVAVAVSADPASGAARGTMVLVHGGGWAGHSATARDRVMSNPGRLLLRLGWRVVSIDHAEGAEGLRDVLDTVDDEVARKTGVGPLCLYGESSGAHLALIAASRRRSVDCVAGLGALTDLPLYVRDAETSTDDQVRVVAGRVSRFFGATAAALAPWDPVTVAPSIRADVLLMHEAGETLVPATQAVRFQAAHPTTRVVELEAGDPADASTTFMHGSVSTRGRAQYVAAVQRLAEQMVVARRAERRAARRGCAGVTRPVAQAGQAGLLRALQCLATKDPAARIAPREGWRQIAIAMYGEVNAARIWARLRTTSSGRSSLAAVIAGGASLTVRVGQRSRVVLQAGRGV